MKGWLAGWLGVGLALLYGGLRVQACGGFEGRLGGLGLNDLAGFVLCLRAGWLWVVGTLAGWQ